MKTSDVIHKIGKYILDKDILVFANGRIVREGYFLGDRKRNFYMLLSMGHASSIGLGIALARPNIKVIIIDGDGNLLMNLGILPLIGYIKPKNLIHIVLDNEAYGTTGGQKTISTSKLFEKVALNCGYKNAATVSNVIDVENLFKRYYKIDGPSLINAKITTEYLQNAPVFNMLPEKIAERFIEALKNER